MTANSSVTALYRAILASSLEGMAIVAPDTSFVEVNSAFASLFDKKPEQVVGMRAVKLFAPQDAQGSAGAAACSITQALQEQQALAYREFDCTINGSARALGLSITPVSGGVEALSLVIARDVTAVRTLQQGQSSYLAWIAHELRSPLNTMHGYLDLALMGLGGELNEQQRDFVQRARASSEHLYALLEDLLFIAKADAAQLRLKRDLADLHELISAALEELELTIADHAVTLDVAVPGDLPLLYVDAVRMQQVLRNLVSNALRTTPRGERITISATLVVADHTTAEQASPTTAQKCLRLQVSDTGSGISAEALQHAFERHSSAAGRSCGQGLGLAIVKIIVELHGGRVMAASTPGQGSTFTCLLPCVLS
jgi:PAS domain S-box-containing protein